VLVWSLLFIFHKFDDSFILSRRDTKNGKAVARVKYPLLQQVSFKEDNSGETKIVEAKIESIQLLPGKLHICNVDTTSHRIMISFFTTACTFLCPSIMPWMYASPIQEYPPSSLARIIIGAEPAGSTTMKSPTCVSRGASPMRPYSDRIRVHPQVRSRTCLKYISLSRGHAKSFLLRTTPITKVTPLCRTVGTLG